MAEYLVEHINHKIWAWRANDRTLTDPYVHTCNRCLEGVKSACAAYYTGTTSWLQAKTLISASISTLTDMSAELSSILDETLAISPPPPKPPLEPSSAFSDSEYSAPAGQRSLWATLHKTISGAAGSWMRKTYGAVKKWINPANKGTGKHGQDGATRYRRRFSRQSNDPFRVSGGERVPDPRERAQNGQSKGSRELESKDSHHRRPAQDGPLGNYAQNPQSVESFYSTSSGNLQRPQSAETTYDGPKHTLSYYLDEEILAGPFAGESSAPESTQGRPDDPRTVVGDPRVCRSNSRHGQPESGHNKGGETRTHRKLMPRLQCVVGCPGGFQEAPAEPHAPHPPLPNTPSEKRVSRAIDEVNFSSGMCSQHAEDILEMLDKMSGLGINF